MARKYIILFIVFTVFCFIGCNKADQTNSLIAEYENKIKSDPDNNDLKEKLMFEYVMTDGFADKVVSMYEENTSLQGRVMCDIYYATALCKMADKAKETTDQMKYVRKGTVAFDQIIEKNPENSRVYMWQAITYSYFPSLLGADELVIEAAEKAEKYHRAGSVLDDEELKYLVLAYCNIAKEYENSSYLKTAEEKYETFKLADEECRKVIDELHKKLKV